MIKQRRTFTPEFKRKAASLLLDQNYSYTEAARSLGLVESALRSWVSQLHQELGDNTPTSKALTYDQQKKIPKIGSPHQLVQMWSSTLGYISIYGSRLKADSRRFLSFASCSYLCATALPAHTRA